MLFNTGLGVRNTLSYNYGSAVDAQGHIGKLPELFNFPSVKSFLYITVVRINKRRFKQ